MKAIQFQQPKALRYVDVPEPPTPGPGDAVVRVHSVGICGTDYGGYLGTMPFFSYPRIPGHELGVEVAALGEGVTNVEVGQRCSVEPYLNCQNCYACSRGHTNCCEHNQTLGVHCDGGLQPLYSVPARKLHPVGSLTSAQAALVETLAIGCHAINRGAPQAGENILVIGAGPIGLSVIEFAKLSGARTIVADVNAQRLAFVRQRMGVPDTIEVGSEGTALKQLAALTDDQLCDVVVDATGSCRSMSAALEFCTFRGRLVYVGITQDEVRFTHAPVMHRRELTLLASRNALPHEFTQIIGLIEDGRINTEPWITHHAGFGEVIDQFPAWLRPETGVIKAIVDMD